MVTRQTTLLKSNAGYMEVSTEGKLAEERLLFLEGSIDSAMAMSFAKQVASLVKQNLDPIKVCINSEGGEIDAGLLIMDVISGCPAKISVYCLEKAYSMAAVIFISCLNGRYMFPNSRLMIHQPSCERIGGNSSKIKQISDLLLKNKDQLYEIIASHSSYTKEELEQETFEDKYFTAFSAVEKRLADEIVTFESLIG